jgi:hypothetical protein
VRRACVLLGVLFCASIARPQDGAGVPTYTDQDLARMTPLRHQTGALSEPAFPPEAGSPPDEGEVAARRTAESHWRREADRLRKRLETLRDQLEDLRLRIEQRRRNPKVPASGDPQIETWERRIERLRLRVVEAESSFEERARRAGALPGWLR